MGLSEEIRQRLIETFKAELKEYIQTITQGLLALENIPVGGDRRPLLNEIFRAAHSLKGSARAVDMATITSLGHGLEGLLLAAKEDRLAFSPELFDVIYQGLDAVELLVANMEGGNDAPPAKVLALLARMEGMIEQAHRQPSGGDVPSKQSSVGTATAVALKEDEQYHEEQPHKGLDSSDTIRVSISKLDALMNQFSELLAAKIRSEQHLTDLQDMQGMMEGWQATWLGLREHYGRVNRVGIGHNNNDVSVLLDFMAQNQEYLRTTIAQVNKLTRQVANHNIHLHLAVDELQEDIKRVRMLPFSTITVAFGRMVRDLAREQGKQIRFKLVGGETELDKRVLELVKDPLIHMLRNAVDHGIELPEVRRQQDKPLPGVIQLTAVQQGSSIMLTVKDDGSGLNLAAIRQTAVDKGILSREEVDRLDETAVGNLIFHPGFTTSKIITDISGRGVGMDVVRRNIESLHGTLFIDFEPGQSTTFTMIMPLTLASTRGLLVDAGGQTFALPLTAVERMLRVQRSEVTAVDGNEVILYQGKPIALARLHELLELPAPDHEDDMLSIVLLRVAGRQLGLIVEQLVGEQEIISKNLGKQLARIGGIAGATLLGSGEALLVLHPADLVKLASRIKPRSPIALPQKVKKSTQQKHIMVVDDSITTRILEKNILEAAGYRVTLATNGEEALSMLTTIQPNLVVSDVNMPFVDGFVMTERLKSDGRYQDIPVILVTSLSSAADKARGIEVGADAYIVKGQFDQGNLLETIEQLI